MVRDYALTYAAQAAHKQVALIMLRTSEMQLHRCTDRDGDSIDRRDTQVQWR